MIAWDDFLTKGIRVNSLQELIRLSTIVSERFNSMSENAFHALPGNEYSFFSIKNYLAGLTQCRGEVDYYIKKTGWSERKVREYLTTLWRVVFHLGS